jgi:hypothetical protein
MFGAGEFRIGFELRGNLTEALLNGWRGDASVFDACWPSWEDKFYPRREIDPDIAEVLLLRGYPQEQKVVSRLADLIRTEDHFFRGGFGDNWGALRASFSKHPIISTALDDWAERMLGKGRFFLREAAFAAVTSCSPRAKQLSISALSSAGSMIFWPVSALLEGWGMSDSDVATSLSNLCKADLSTIQHFAHFLPSILVNKTECRRVLLSIARLDRVERPDFLVEAFTRLGIDGNDKEVVDALTPLVDSDVPLFSPVARLISGFGDDPRVRAMAHDIVLRRDAPLAEIAAAYRSDTEMRRLVLRRLAPLPDELRLFLISRAARRCDEAPLFDQLLSDYDSEREPRIRTVAEAGRYESLARRLEHSDATTRLSKEIRSIGPEMDGLRQSALAGLLSVNKLSEFVDLKESTGNPLKVPALEDWREMNQPLVELIATHWHQVHSLLRDSAFERLSQWGGDPASSWNALAPFVGASDTTRQAFLGYCQETKQKLRRESLQALARLEVRSALLLEHCRREFGQTDEPGLGSSFNEITTQLLAGKILGTVYCGDSEIRTFLENQPPASGVVVGLCLGWPDSAYLDHIYDQIRERNPIHLVPPAVLYVASARGDLDTFERVLFATLSRARGEIWDFSPECLDPIVLRLSRDEELYHRVFIRLLKSSLPDEKATIPRLLALARTGDTELMAWCAGQIGVGNEHRIMPEHGFDFVAGRVRPVDHALLEVLIPYGDQSWSRPDP